MEPADEFTLYLSGLTGTERAGMDALGASKTEHLRYLTRAHTAMQLLAGAVLGTVMALLSVYAARRITRRDKKEHDS